MATLSDVVSSVNYGLLDLVDNSMYPSDYIKKLITEEYRAMCDQFPWVFLRKRKTILFPERTTLTDDIEEGDTSISVSSVSVDPPTTGALLVGYDLIPYTGWNSPDPDTIVFTGIGEFDMEHAEGESLLILPALPDDYNNTPTLNIAATPTSMLPMEYVDENTIVINSQHTTDIYPDRAYTLLSANNGQRYIHLLNNYQLATVLMKYFRVPTPMVLDSDVCSIPEPYHSRVLASLVVYRARKERMDNIDGVADEQGQLAMKYLLELKKKFGEEEQAWDDIVQNPYTQQLQASRNRHIVINRNA